MFFLGSFHLAKYIKQLQHTWSHKTYLETQRSRNGQQTGTKTDTQTNGTEE